MAKPAHISEEDLANDPALEALVSQALALPQRGRPGAKPPPTILREIGPEDEVDLRGERDAPQVRPLERVRTTHHLAARELALGRKVVDVAAVTGYTPQRISDLKNDPTFRDLVAHYRAQHDERRLNVQERLEALGIALTEEILERLEAVPESFSNEELRRWAETALDRAGHGPQATRTLNVNSRSVSLSLIEKIKAEVGDGAEVKLLEG